MPNERGSLRNNKRGLQPGHQLLQEQVNRTSANSSQPPSQDPPKGFKPSRSSKSGKKSGGQPGHKGHNRGFYPLEQCQSQSDHYPEACWNCGTSLVGEDPSPYRHQIGEIPPIVPQLAEHRFHQLVCPDSGCGTRALIPEFVEHGYGVNLVAHVGLLSSLYRHSHRLVQQAMLDLLGVEMSLGSVNQLRPEARGAVAEAVAAVGEYVQHQPVVGMDETSFIKPQLQFKVYDSSND